MKPKLIQTSGPSGIQFSRGRSVHDGPEVLDAQKLIKNIIFTPPQKYNFLHLHKKYNYPLINFVMGYCDHFCLSVCLSVCVCLCVILSGNTIKGELSIRFWWNLVRLCIIIIERLSSKMGCPLIFKATAVKKKTVRNDENQPLQEWFSTYWCQICTVDVKLNNLKDIKALLTW